ncbi:MAG: hypothetical protein HFI42_12375 [Lachnospiraceae bacterium]|jgi:hypothetical protein|nr:hypothetical protein [Lachnospiraceae bacterium]MCI9151266.1 hypothetical protein [Lachnospiraceae bacterium]
MTALELVDIKDFMNKLLGTDLMDHFLMPEAAITTCITHTIDGHMHPEFYGPADEEYEQLRQNDICPFSLVRPMCFDLMKGRRTPLSFHFVFQLSPENQQRTIERSGCRFRPEDISGMFLNLRYQDRRLTCTTGISYRSFSLDKSLEQEWDRLVMLFFKNHQIPFTPL